MTNSKRDISLDAVLKKLNEWRHLPAYKLETRMDVLIGLNVDEIVAAAFKDDYPDLKAKELKVISEFPLHRGEVFGDENKYSKNRSTKVDFALFSQREKRIFFVELKTNNDTITDKQKRKAVFEQLNRMKDARRKGAEQVLNGVIELVKHSQENHKYAHLIWKLLQLKCVELRKEPEFYHLNKSHPTPNCFKEFVKNLKHYRVIDFGESNEWKDTKIKCVLIFPGDIQKNGTTKSDFKWIKNDCPWVKSIQFQPKVLECYDEPLKSFLEELVTEEAGDVEPWKFGNNDN